MSSLRRVYPARRRHVDLLLARKPLHLGSMAGRRWLSREERERMSAARKEMAR